jgi:hypothetical protein
MSRTGTRVGPEGCMWLTAEGTKLDAPELGHVLCGRRSVLRVPSQTRSEREGGVESKEIRIMGDVNAGFAEC